MALTTAETEPERIVFQGRECLLPEMPMLGWARFPRADASLGPHHHKHAYEICYIVHGSVDWWASDQVYEVGPGEVYITRPDELHGGLDAMMHPNELYWLHLRMPPRGLSTADTNTLARDYAAMELRTFPGSSAIHDAFARLFAEHRERQPYSASIARATLHQLLITVLRDHADHARLLRDRSAAQSDAVGRALAWMDGHLADDYSVEEVAAVADLSISHFHERFVKEVGFTPADHRARARINRAKQLLRASDLSILDVAMNVGFSTSQYFATVFKNLTGITPRQYRAHLQK